MILSFTTLFLGIIDARLLLLLDAKRGEFFHGEPAGTLSQSPVGWLIGILWGSVRIPL